MTDKYVTFKQDSTLDQRLIESLHEIPEGAVPVSEDLWFRLTQETDCLWKIDANGVIAKHPAAPPSDQDLIARALVQRDRLLGFAAVRIAPLQYAVDRGEATPEEESRLRDWQTYCIDLNRIESQMDFPRKIEWPITPDAGPDTGPRVE